MTLQITEHNAQTGEIITRPMNDDELKRHQDLLDLRAAELAKKEAAQKAKAEAEAKLSALGLTTDDLRALGL